MDYREWMREARERAGYQKLAADQAVILMGRAARRGRRFSARKGGKGYTK